jgi:peroxiredoxin
MLIDAMQLLSIAMTCALSPSSGTTSSEFGSRAEARAGGRAESRADGHAEGLADGFIGGRVFDVHEKPAAGIHVILGELGHALLFYPSPAEMFVSTPGILDPESKRYRAEAITDRDGRFVASGLAPGEFTLIAADESRGVALSHVRVEAGESSSVEIALEPPCFLEAKITGLDLDPQANTLELIPLGQGTNISFFPHLSHGLQQWSFTSTALPAIQGWRVIGCYVVPVQDYRATLFALPVSIAAGEHAALAVDLASGLELSGRVADARGEPLPGVSVVARGSGESPPMRGTVTDAKGRYRLRGLASGPCTLDVARWSVRELPGCGNGPQDVSTSREIVLPLEKPSDADFRIESLLRAPLVGDAAPAFTARTIDGRELALSSLRGKVILIDFWATWCVMCRMEMPNLLATYAELARDGRFEIVGVSVDTDLGLVPRFVASRGLAWPQTALGAAAVNPIARLYDVNSTPSTVLIDREGRIVALNLTGEPLRKKIDELLRAK